jgi:hypothetical protein
MLLLEAHISNFTCARYYFLYVEFNDFYVNQSLAGQIIEIFILKTTMYDMYNIKKEKRKKK